MKKPETEIKRVTRPAFRLAGVLARTSNSLEAGPNGKIPGLWEQFFSSNMVQDHTMERSFIYGLYTEYEEGVHGDYTLLIGYEETEGPEVEESASYAKAKVPASDYLVFTSSRGPMHQVVPETWQRIWSYFLHSDERRSYTGDFELYPVSVEGFNPVDTQVEVYIAVQ
ncbi:GyrI-like domain-containing protein [Paenibacillus lemnae]|uniref:AraC family transcriptional regulator n=1 Tax=Paenibacillus lemnae TaxID=1330551 RepID=A0A848M2K0_PAELE|nr:GyrI-like domain-containing protein [Paenibacillus lemnae]NMO95127.1 AraC family transcriptional regulator [Paenibacillus lemnae]